jgi:hypothetical protein
MRSLSPQRTQRIRTDFVTSATCIRPETTAQANDSERRVASASREIASKAPEIAAGLQKSRDLRVPPTSRDRSVFPPPSSVFAAQWFVAESEQCDKVDLAVE